MLDHSCATQSLKCGSSSRNTMRNLWQLRIGTGNDDMKIGKCGKSKYFIHLERRRLCRVLEESSFSVVFESDISLGFSLRDVSIRAPRFASSTIFNLFLDSDSFFQELSSELRRIEMIAQLQPLKSIVGEPAPRSQALRNFAVAQHIQCLWPGNLIEITDEHDIVIVRRSFIGKMREHLST